MNYMVNQGEFIPNDKQNSFNFNGNIVQTTNPLTKVESSILSYGEILFSERFREGTITFDINFDKIFPETRAGIILNYQSIDGTTTFYQIGIKNAYVGYGIDYYNGTSWEFRVAGGQPSILKSFQNYSISIDVHGNNLSLFINGVNVVTYTQFVNNFSGVCGIYVLNGAKSTVSNINIEPEKPTVFTIMKYEPDFDDLYNDVIKSQCDKMGLTAIRADECYTTNIVINDIISQISTASIIIADITMDNPNVFYEIGYAHALQKPTILLADVNRRDRLPFDISGYRTIFYSNTIGGKKDIDQNLHKYLKSIVTSNRRLK